jgi:hypothetical protein
MKNMLMALVVLFAIVAAPVQAETKACKDCCKEKCAQCCKTDCAKCCK